VKFIAKWAGYNMIVRDEERDYYPDGRSRLVKPALVVDFGQQALGVETYAGVDSDDSPTFTGIRGGGYYDTEVGQKRNNWSDEERELVEQRLLELADNGPDADQIRMMPRELRPGGFEDVKLYEEPRPVAPFQNYDSLSADKVVRISSELGCEERTLAYEQQTKNRKQVVEAMLELIDMKRAEHELTAAN
jgi:hypothetical protein